MKAIVPLFSEKIRFLQKTFDSERERFHEYLRYFQTCRGLHRHRFPRPERERQGERRHQAEGSRHYGTKRLYAERLCQRAWPEYHAHGGDPLRRFLRYLSGEGHLSAGTGALGAGLRFHAVLHRIPAGGKGKISPAPPFPQRGRADPGRFSVYRGKKTRTMPICARRQKKSPFFC